LAVEGVIVGGLIATNALPARASSVPAGALFPLDVYFDIKHWVAFAPGWVSLVLLIGMGLLVRTSVLAATLALGDEQPLRNSKAWLGCLRLTATAALAFVPVAILFFSGAALRYAPFIWVAAPIGLAIAISFCRRGIRLDTGAGAPPILGLPEAASFLSYAFVVAIAGACVSSLGGHSRILGALFVACLGPLHALFLLGWRENARAGTYPGGGAISVAVTVVLAVSILAGTVYDRYIRTAPPVAEARSPGSLLLLGGADSTSTTGALQGIDVRSIGYTESRARVLSYVGPGRRYGRIDTHGDPSEVASTVARQISSVKGSVRVLGHSQASLILDHVVARRGAEPDAIAVLAPAPPRPPALDVPPPGSSGPGRVGGDTARGLAAVLRAIGLPGFDIDAPAAPLNLVVSPSVISRVPRMAVWALADSVWLDQDWRRPGELNFVVISDHVGATTNGRSLFLVDRFFAGHSLEGDEASWRGTLVPILRYAFEPWRPW
jgi:hypothetical protein